MKHIWVVSFVLFAHLACRENKTNGHPSCLWATGLKCSVSIYPSSEELESDRRHGQLAKSKWIDQAIESYNFTYTRDIPTCNDQDPHGEITTSVENHLVVSVVSSTGGVIEENLQDWPTISSLNSDLEQFLDQGEGIILALDFDHELGYPLKIQIEHIQDPCLSFYLVISDFSPN